MTRPRIVDPKTVVDLVSEIRKYANAHPDLTKQQLQHEMKRIYNLTSAIAELLGYGGLERKPYD
jgi:hypothetical protein